MMNTLTTVEEIEEAEDKFSAFWDNLESVSLQAQSLARGEAAVGPHVLMRLFAFAADTIEDGERIAEEGRLIQRAALTLSHQGNNRAAA